MYITKVNGNEVKEVEIDVDREDIIKTLFIIPPCDTWFNENKPEGITLEEVVNTIYEHFDDFDIDLYSSDHQIENILNKEYMNYESES